MRRILADSAKVAVAALFLGLAGCGGSGIEEGIPKDLTPAVPPELMKADMRSRSAPPSQLKAEPKAEGAPTAAPKN
jgi:hypothetical protein